MAKLLAANNAGSTLANSISDVAVSANLQSGTGILFPHPGAGEYFIGTFTSAADPTIQEIVHVTSVIGDTITIVRAQEGTANLAWSANDLFDNLITKGTFESYVQAADVQDDSFNYGVDTGSTNAYIVALDPVVSVAPAAGFRVSVKIGNSNNGSSTLDAGFGAVLIKRRLTDGTEADLVGGEMFGGEIVTFRYDGTYWQLEKTPLATDAMAVAGTDKGAAITPFQVQTVIAGFQTGDVVHTMQTTARSGWIFMTGSIGNSGSGATQRANADTVNLYTMFWNGYSDSICPVSGGRGGSAASDFAANKTLTMPDARGTIMAAAENMGGTNRGNLGTGATGGFTGAATIGLQAGEKSHQITVAELASHNHSAQWYGGDSGLGGVGSGHNVNADNNVTGSAGSNAAHNNIQPTLVCNVLIKL